MSPFDRIHTGQPSIFAADQTFRTSEYGQWLALDLVKPPPWPAFRDARLAAKAAKEAAAPRVAKPLSGHANLPLNLPGSHDTPRGVAK